MYSERKIKATRKPHQCQSCLRLIETGSPSLYYVCKNYQSDGMFYGHHHPECREAELAMNALMDYRDGDDWYPLHEIDSETLPWLKDEFPTAYARLIKDNPNQ